DKLGKLAKAGQQVIDENKGAVCAATGKAIGPCVEQFIPKPDGGEGNSGFANLAGKGNLGLVIEGVPVNVAAGYGVKVSRTAKNYTVTISGEATALIKAAMEKKGGAWGEKGPEEKGGGIGISGTLPAKARAIMGLNGSAPGPIPAIPFGKGEKAAEGGGGEGAKAAPPAKEGHGGAPPAKEGAAPEPEKPVTASAGASAGKKGTVTLTYTFDATADKTTCDGLGGLTSFLAGQGLAASLPAPFSGLASGVSANAFADKLTSAKFALSDVAGANLDLKAGEAATVQLAAAAESGVAIEFKKEARKSAEKAKEGAAGKEGAAAGEGEGGKKPEMDDVIAATLFQTISGKAGIAVAAASMPIFNASIGASGGATLGMSYNLHSDALSASLETTIGASFSLASFAGVAHLLPGKAGAAARKRLDEVTREGQQGTVAVEAKTTIAAGDLQKLVGELDSYFAKPESVTAAGVWGKVAKYLEANMTTTGELAVKLSVDEKMLGLSADYNDGKGTGGGAELELSRGKETELYKGDL
ncbi:MAG: hypothetical protein KC635_24920, partial [Myxococcales bacterium]|nr:hypothetical protein [Myxococcales bacterium]